MKILFGSLIFLLLIFSYIRVVFYTVSEAEAIMLWIIGMALIAAWLWAIPKDY